MNFSVRRSHRFGAGSGGNGWTTAGPSNRSDGVASGSRACRFHPKSCCGDQPLTRNSTIKLPARHDLGENPRLCSRRRGGEVRHVEHVDRYRLRKQEALPELDAEPPDTLALVLRFDAFGDNGKVQ